MAELNKLNANDLETVSGGTGRYNSEGYRTVCRLETGYLAMRTAATYDTNNEIRGAELYNGDQVKIVGASVAGVDGRTYIQVYSDKTGTTGYVNAAFLA